MTQPPRTLFRVTSLSDRSVRVHYVLERPKREQTVKIDIWYMWGQGYLSEDNDLSNYIKFIECNTEIPFQVETPVAQSFVWEGPDWNDKAQHRMQKDLAKGGIQRILEQQNSWRLVETKLWINAPFKIDVVDFLNNNIVMKNDISYKGQIRS